MDDRQQPLAERLRTPCEPRDPTMNTLNTCGNEAETNATGNFVFTDGAGNVYVGYAAHCAGTGAATDTAGCSTASLPLGTWVLREACRQARSWQREGLPALTKVIVSVSKIVGSKKGLVVLAVGSSGALDWFAPAQPLLAVASIAFLVWALRARLQYADACPVLA